MADYLDNAHWNQPLLRRRSLSPPLSPAPGFSFETPEQACGSTDAKACSPGFSPEKQKSISRAASPKPMH